MNLLFPENIKFHLFENCKLVKGKNRSVIYDLQRNAFDYIPISLHDIIELNRGKTFSEIKAGFSNEDSYVLIEYFNFLYKNEYVFFSDLDINFFPPLSQVFLKPYNIYNLIIDIEENDEEHLNSLYNIINNELIESLTIRFKSKEINMNNILYVLNFFNDTPCKIFHLFIDDSVKINDVEFNNLINTNQRISFILKYNAKKETFKKYTKGVLLKTKVNIFNEAFVNVKSISDFYINLDLYNESLQFNSYYHRRFYIDSTGNIRRFEKDLINFGNISNTKLSDLYNYDEEFKTLWDIKKDEIYLCNVCEYRYMCTDSRLPLSRNEDNLWVLDGECNYNPLTSEWKKNA